MLYGPQLARVQVEYTEHVKFVYDMMNTAISTELINELCFIIVFDAIKQSINQLTDIPNHTLDKIVSIIMNNGGVVSNRKRDLVLPHLDPQNLAIVEQAAQDLINKIKQQFGIDIQGMA